MRDLNTKRKQAKKQKRNTLIISIVLIVIISASVFGIVANSFDSESEAESKEINYNGYEFVPIGSFWILNAGEFEFVFAKNPQDVENISFEENITNMLPFYAQKVLYIYSEDSYSTYELNKNLSPFIVRFQFSCLQEDEEKCPEDSPIKNCTDNFIVIRESNSSRIYQQENCVFIEGDKEELILLTDAFLLKILGIRA